MVDCEYRQEADSVGSLRVPKEAYYGVNAKRAYQNFQITGTRLDPLFIDSLVEVKKATALANMQLGELEQKVGEAIVTACDEMLDGQHLDAVIVDPIQGGAGTSSNMNINEILANRAIELLGGEKGQYELVSPTDHVNRGQSTNDVFPTAGKITFLKKATSLLEVLERLEKVFQEKAEKFATIKKMGRTQLSDAVPITVGREFGAYASVTRRNIDRLTHVMKEIEVINLGGTAIGTGISAHPDLSKTVEKYLNLETELDLRIADDLVDGTQNIDSFAMLADCLKTIGISTSKIANDIRLLSSGPRTGFGELIIPAKQNGSSIMPGKINPVIPEVVNQSAFLVAGNSVTVSMAVESGQLELNAFEPVIFYCMIQSFNALEKAFSTFIDNCLIDIQVNEKRCEELLESSTYLTTGLAKTIGYEKAAKIAKQSLADGRSVREIAIEQGISEDLINELAGSII
ncbi:aspartate ammonia-lyase [Vagococcus humatus]|uniref:Aspartate ammonia-lyase n=1 Tax=Vagococcus humatus TaxID=1889241 RepID=A0A3R9ZWQ0_9ENTE|nr:aspartate ammonia-lyase [Vagococcus humatus]RST89533.1 aspartate ammonia-lyase [Vagococcus humatus]